MSNSVRRKTKVETPPIVSKTGRTQRRSIEARLQDHPLRVNAADLPRRRFLHLAASAAALPAVSCEPGAQSYPSRPITMIVGYAAGAATDTIGRIIADRMKSALGQRVIVENVTGAGGTVGAGRVARAAPDGYTLSLGNNNSHVLAGASYALQSDILNDFEPVALISTSALVLTARKTMPANDLRGLIWLKANPDKATLGGATGSAGHIAGVFFQRETGTHFQFVPYTRGATQIIQDLMASQIDMTIADPVISLPLVRAGTIKAYGVTTKTRSPSAPDIPTLDETGLPGFDLSLWQGLWLPKRAERLGRLLVARENLRSQVASRARTIGSVKASMTAALSLAIMSFGVPQRNGDASPPACLLLADLWRCQPTARRGRHYRSAVDVPGPHDRCG
jgi:tripartite-type tricarboxylate transporter receptor subunit TctC